MARERATPDALDVRRPGERRVTLPTTSFTPRGVITNDPIEVATREADLPSRPPVEVLRRQRLLRAAGYRIVVDGRWGPRSQKAWNDYTSRRSSVPFKPEKNAASLPVVESVREPLAGVTPDEMRASREFQREQARKAAAVQRASFRARVLRDAQAIKLDPGYARKLSLHQLALALTDRESGLNLATSSSGARATQEWLNSRGYKVPITGTYQDGGKTHAALEKAAAAQRVREMRRRTIQLQRRLYQFLPADVEPGTSPSWWKAKFGDRPIPRPAELARMIATGDGGGGFQTDMMLRELMRRAFTGEAAFDQVRHSKLLNIAQKVAPFGAAAMAAVLDSANAVSSDQLFMEIMGADNLVPAPDFTDVPDEWRARLVEEWAKDPRVVLENAKRVAGLRAQTSALYSAKNADDFKRKFAAYVRVEEQKFTDFQKQLASSSVPWWGRAVEKVLAPGEFLRTALVYDVMRGTQIVTGMSDGERAVQWEDALVALGANPDEFGDYDGLARSANIGLRLGFELTADPLNFAHPFRTASTFLRAGTHGSVLGGYALRGGLHEADGLIARTKALAGSSLVYQRGTWKKADVFHAATRGVFNNPAVETATHKMRQLKDEAVAAARERVKLMERHGFTKVAREGVHVDDFELTPPKGEVAALLSESRVAVRQAVLESPELSVLLNSLRNGSVSLYVDSARRHLSNVGASLLATVTEMARVGAANQLGVEYGWRVFDGIYNDAVIEGVTPAARSELRRQAERAAFDEYVRVVEGAGSYLKGGAVAKDIQAEVHRRAIQRMDDFESVFLPVIQEILEESADTAFRAARGPAAREAGETVEHALWDEAGLWRGRNSEASGAVRSLARESFEKPLKVANPQSGVGHTLEEMNDLVEAELRRRTPRVYGFVARNLASGQLSDHFDASAEIQKIREELVGRPDSAWQKVGNEWFDTRVEVEVSDLYARNYRGLGDAAQEFFKRGRSEKFLTDDPWLMGVAQLSESPMFAAKSEVESGLWRLTWQLGSRFGELPGGWSTVLGHSVDQVQSEIERAVSLRQAVTRQKFALSRAYDEALPKQLLREGAVMAAWSHHQGRILKRAYLALRFVMNSWIFATLPLRPGWMVRNVIDNAAKLIVAGVRNPLHFFIGGQRPGQLVSSVFDLGLKQIRESILFLDQLFNTNAIDHWMQLEAQIWQLSSDTLSRIFKTHGVEVPEVVLDSAKFDPFFAKSARVSSAGFDVVAARDLGLPLTRAERKHAARIEAARLSGEPLGSQKGLAERFREGAWDLMGNRPENYFKRVLYRDEFTKAVNAGSEETAAHEVAWRAVEDTLFDYSKITATEDNFRVLFPFIQFWRKNTTFWSNSFASKPWLTNAALQVDAARRESHPDLPPWMRRYLHVDELTDAASYIPGLDKVVAALIPDDVMYDPANLLSFAPFYRTYLKLTGREKDAGLPPVKTEGWPLVGTMLDAISDFGLGIAPWVRKPLESQHIATDRGWQSVFPQTSVVAALSREWFGDNVANKVLDWERVFTLMQGDTPSDQIAENFDFYVQQEVAGQVARGEEANIAAAESTVRAWFATQNVWGYFTGMYLRRATPEDLYLSKLQWEMLDPDGRENFTDREWDLIRLWGMRGGDRLTWERYIDLLPVITAYYRSDSFDDRERIKADHPEIIRWVDGSFRGRPISNEYVRDAQKYVDTEKFQMSLKLVESVDAPFAIRDAALDTFATPELKSWWRRNDTKADIRERMLRAAQFDYFSRLNQQYHSIPENDFEARDGFLDHHPELVRHWNRNNSGEDDFETIISSGNAAARELYFSAVKAGGFEAGSSILKAMPFMFEDTRSAGRIDESTGEWIAGLRKDGTWKEGWSAERSAAWRAVSSNMRWFFDDYMPRVGKKAAWSWLETSDSPVAKAIKDYLARYAKRSARSLAWLKARSWLKLYFSLPPDEARKWLAGNSEGAEIVRWYFENYASEKGMTQHARDYLEHKPLLDFYFSLPKKNRRYWLYGGSADALSLLSYFKKYGQNHKFERAWKRLGAATGVTPEQMKRIDFWRQFYSLSPDQRPAFILEHAEDHGVFIYGEFGEQERHDREQEYMRRAVSLGASDRQAAYLYVKPLLDFYFTLGDDEKALFLRANPEVSEYLDRYADRKVTGDARLDASIETYFKLPPDSFARSEFLRTHPEVQDWFDDRGSPAEKAMRNLLEQYFRVEGANERGDFLAMHPEVAAYFEARRQEKSNESATFDAFDRADPRLAPFFSQASELEAAAERVRQRLERSALSRLAPDSLETRRSRRPA